MLDFSTDLGRRIARQLESERVIWLTTVGSDNTPQPRPVWFVWDGTSLLVYSQPETYKILHIARSSKVALHFSTDPEAHEVSVLTGEATVEPSAPPADKHAEYLEKYREGIGDLGQTPREFAEDYSVAIIVRPKRLRGF